jgi:ABC-type nickel/cobalt efflux system permease component RcnA
MKKPASLVAAIVFWLIALAQVVRVILRVRVTAGSHDIPLWLSSVAFVVFGTLGLWLWRERQEKHDELQHNGKHGPTAAS